MRQAEWVHSGTCCGQMEEKGSDKDNSWICAAPFLSFPPWFGFHVESPKNEFHGEKKVHAPTISNSNFFLSPNLHITVHSAHASQLSPTHFLASSAEKMLSVLCSTGPSPLTRDDDEEDDPAWHHCWPSVSRITGGFFQPSHKVCARLGLMRCRGQGCSGGEPQFQATDYSLLTVSAWRVGRQHARSTRMDQMQWR